MRYLAKLLLMLLVILFLWSFAGVGLFGQETEIPPDILMVNDLNCIIHQWGKHRFQAICTANYLNHDNYHRDPFPVKLPEEKTEKASYNDTVKWRRMVLKIQATAKPVDVNQLKKEKQ